VTREKKDVPQLDAEGIIKDKPIESKIKRKRSQKKAFKENI